MTSSENFILHVLFLQTLTMVMSISKTLTYQYLAQAKENFLLQLPMNHTMGNKVMSTRINVEIPLKTVLIPSPGKRTPITVVVMTILMIAPIPAVILAPANKD